MMYLGERLTPRETLERDAKSLRANAAELIADGERLRGDAQKCKDTAAALTARADEFEAAAKLLPASTYDNVVIQQMLIGGKAA